MKNLAVIPARSGSKGLKDKNIRLLNDMPLMAYTIKAASGSGIFDRIHVSTDSEIYAAIGRDYGADIPFLREKELASDSADSWDVVKSVLRKYQDIGKEFDMVTLLQPTSPLRTSQNIVEAYKLYHEKQAGAIVSVCEMEHSPLWSNVLPDDLSMESFIRNADNVRRQELRPYYRINGAIYMVRCSFLFENPQLYRNGCYGYVMDAAKSIDIDTELDFEIAGFLIGNQI